MNRKLLFVTIDSNKLRSNVRPAEVVRPLIETFKSLFPEHEVIVLTDEVAFVKEFSDGGEMLIYKRPDEDKIIYIPPLEDPREGKFWWEYPITVSTTELTVGESGNPEEPHYQTNIFDYLKEKKE